MLNRRNFIQDSLALVASGFAVPSFLTRGVVAGAAERNSASVSGKTLIVLQMAGGVDGLNTVIPYADPAYREHRPTLAVEEKDLLVVDDRTAFPSALKGFKELLDGGKLAVVEGVGYPQPNFSHFKAMDIWQSADLRGYSDHGGWLSRTVGEMIDRDGHPLTAVSIGRQLPEAFDNPSVPVTALASIETYKLASAADDPEPAKRQASLAQLYDHYRPLNARFAALLDTTLDNSIRSSEDLTSMHAGYRPAVTYPNTALAEQLRMMAEVIHADGGTSPLRVGHVFIGGFDTHTQEETRLPSLLTQTSDALAAFWKDIEAHGHADDVLVMTWSEFGRRVKENSQDGTDHGSAGPMFLVGNAVKPGFHGDRPSLTNLDNGNLRHTTDFRSVYATVLQRWLQAPAADVLGAKFPELDLLRV